MAIVGYYGAGTVTQTGGSFTTHGSYLFLGLAGGSSGSYSLGGMGSLSTGEAFIGDGGPGTFTQSGGSFITNNGTQSGTLDVNYDSTANGSGTFGDVNVNPGGSGNNSVNTGGSGNNSEGGLSAIRLTGGGGLAATAPLAGPQLNASPGTTNVGSLTLHGGSTFSIRVQNATGAAGSGYDLTNASGTLTLASDASSSNQIVIALSSLNSSGNPGAAANFNPAQNYQFILVQTGGGIVGYAGPGEFAVDTTGFANALQGGSFSVVEEGNDLVLDFNAVPEPGTEVMLLGGVGLLMMAARRHRARRVSARSYVSAFYYRNAGVALDKESG